MKKWWSVFAIVAMAGLMTGCGMEQVDEGFRGIKTNLGKVVGEPLTPGLYFYNPLTSDIFEMDVKEHKWEGEEPAFTRDTQTVMVKYAVTMYPDPTKIADLYKQFGKSWDEKLIPPTTSSTIKDSIGQYVADDLVSKREAARKAALVELKANLLPRGIIVTDLSIINLDFNDEYEKAVERKVKAVQEAAEAHNRTVQVQEEAKQKVLSAQADAEAMRIKSQALSQNKGLVQYEAIQKWDGKLPHIMFGNSTPIINMNDIMKGSN